MRTKKKSRKYRKYRKKSRNLSKGPIYLNRYRGSFLSRASLAVLERLSTTWLTSNKKKTLQPLWENTSRFTWIDRRETETGFRLYRCENRRVVEDVARVGSVDRCLITPEIPSCVPENRNLRCIWNEIRAVFSPSTAPHLRFRQA